MLPHTFFLKKVCLNCMQDYAGKGHTRRARPDFGERQPLHLVPERLSANWCRRNSSKGVRAGSESQTVTPYLSGLKNSPASHFPGPPGDAATLSPPRVPEPALVPVLPHAAPRF